MEVHQATENHVQMTVSSDDHRGRVAIINLDQGTLDTLTNNDVVVAIDGKAINQTQNPLDVMSSSGSEDGDAVYCIESTSKGSQMLIDIPSFSTHVLDISSISPLASVLNFTGLMAVLGAMATVGVAAFLLLGRKGKR